MIYLADFLLVVNDRSCLFDHEVAEVWGIEDGKSQSDAIDRRIEPLGQVGEETRLRAGQVDACGQTWQSADTLTYRLSFR